MRITFTFFVGLCTSFLMTAQQGIHGQTIIDSALHSIIAHNGGHPVHSCLLYMKDLQSDLEIHKGVGIVGRSDEPVTENFQYKVASITKTFVAVVALQLEEEGSLQLDDKAYSYLEDLGFLRYDEFHNVDGVPYSQEITIRQLLNHTSGIADIFTDKEVRFVLSVLLNKKRSFDEEKVVRMYFGYNLHKESTHLPGQGYHYSDMNYMLLGFIIEKVTGQSLVANIRSRILDPLDMGDTYYEYYEPVRGFNRQVDTYLNKINITRWINTSYEWGGGGLVSTVKDMGIFIEALFNGSLLQSEATLEKMISITTTKKFGKEAGMGIFKYEVNGKDYYGHGGYYGSLLLYSPEENFVFSIHVSQANAQFDPQTFVDSLVQIAIDQRRY